MISCRWAELLTFWWTAIHFLVGTWFFGWGCFGCSRADHFDDNSCQARGIGTAMVPACAPRVFVPWGGLTDKTGQKEGWNSTKEDQRGGKVKSEARVR